MKRSYSSFSVLCAAGEDEYTVQSAGTSCNPVMIDPATDWLRVTLSLVIICIVKWDTSVKLPVSCPYYIDGMDM